MHQVPVENKTGIAKMDFSKIQLVTQNKGKVEAASVAFQKLGVALVPATRDYPEIQASTSLEVAKHTALEAAKMANLPSIREDHSLFLGDTKFPGPFTAWFEKSITPEMLVRIADAIGGRQGYFEVATVLGLPDGTFFDHTFRVPVKIAFAPEGDIQRGWDRVLIVGNDPRVIATYPMSERVHLWTAGFDRVVEYISRHVASNEKRTN